MKLFDMNPVDGCNISHKKFFAGKYANFQHEYNQLIINIIQPNTHSPCAFHRPTAMLSRPFHGSFGL